MTSENSNQKKWEDRPQVKKGTLGESLVDKYIQENHLVPYHAVFDGPHPFDRLIASPDKTKLFIAEIKTKARRKKYADTGFDIKCYNEYKLISSKYNLEIFMFFVDNDLKKIYGNWLRILEEKHEENGLCYPCFWDNIIYFPISKMKDICVLTVTETKRLNELSTGKYK
jgi:hypothetical protein